MKTAGPQPRVARWLDRGCAEFLFVIVTKNVPRMPEFFMKFFAADANAEAAFSFFGFAGASLASNGI